MRRVQLVRGEGRGVSSQYGREGGGGGETEPLHDPPRARRTKSKATSRYRQTHSTSSKLPNQSPVLDLKAFDVAGVPLNEVGNFRSGFKLAMHLGGGAPPAPPLPPVLTGHASSLTPY